MKKTLRLFFVAVLAMVGLNTTAQEVTLDFTSAENPWNLPTDYDKTEKSYSNNGVTITINAATNGHKVNTKEGYLIFGKQDATLTFSAFTFDVEMIKITGRAGASGKVTQNIFVGENAVSTETTGATGTNSYKIADDYQAAGTIYVLKLTNANNTQITKIEIFKKGSGTKEGAGLSWGTGSRTVTIGSEENLFPELANPNNLAVTYSSSNEEVATIAADGAITLVAAGSTIISASFAGDDKYEAQEVNYTLTVKAAGGDTPEPQPVAESITVAKALELIAALEDGKTTTETYRVEGVVISFDDDFNPTYGNYTMNIADAATDTQQLKVYRAKNADNQKFTEDVIKAGDKVVVEGKLQKYASKGVVTPEISSGKIMTVNGESTSGISNVTMNNGKQVIYNLAGQRIQTAKKGLYIINGKKVILK